MRRSSAVVVAALAALALGFQVTGDLAVEFVDTTNYPLIRIVLTPPEELRVSGLERSQVDIQQDGEDVDFILRALETEPVAVVLLIDVSGSMIGSPIDAARSAARGFVDSLPQGSDIAIVTFGTSVEVIADFDTSRDELLEAIDTITATGETAVYDAMIEAVRLVGDAPTRRQFLVLLSDGGDTESTATLDQTTSALEGIDVGFYAVSLFGSEFDPAALDAMAEAADGRVVSANASGLSDIYEDIAAELAAQYAAVVEVIHGGPSTFNIAVQGADTVYEAEFTIDLPAESPEPAPSVSPGGTRQPVVTTTTLRTITPPPIAVVGPPGFWGGEVARLIGLAALFVVFTTAIWWAIKPQETEVRRRGMSDVPVGHGYTPPGRMRQIGRRMQERIETMLERRGRTKGISAALESAGIALRPGEFVGLAALGATVGLLFGLAVGNPALGLLLAVSAGVASRLLLSSRANKRRANFGDQLEGTLQLMAGTLRAGYGVGQAISTVATEAEEPTAGEFARVVVETRLGRHLHEALIALADRMGNKDFRWIADAIDIQQNVGGDLAEVLDTVASTIRDRNQIRRQVQALSAEGRMSAIILISLPFAIGALISVTNPDYLSELTGTFIGRVLLIGGVVLMAIGTAWIRKIIKVVF